MTEYKLTAPRKDTEHAAQAIAGTGTAAAKGCVAGEYNAIIAITFEATP